MIQGIDHIVLRVDDLDAAMMRYRDLGFTVNPGGKHPRGTHNALVTFQDGSYLELIAFREPGYTDHRWHRHLATRRGLIDFALATDQLEPEVAALRRRGPRYAGPDEGGRKRPDGIDLIWRVAAVEDETDTALPFLIEDVTDRDLRVPAAAAAVHANGVRGVDRIIVAVHDLASATSRYASLLDAEPLADTGGHSGETAAGTTFRTGSHWIELRQSPHDGSLSGQGQRLDEGPYALVLFGAAEFPIRPEDAGGARLRVIARGHDEREREEHG